MAAAASSRSGGPVPGCLSAVTAAAVGRDGRAVEVTGHVDENGLITVALQLDFRVVKLKDVESLQIWQPSNHSDFSCPICLQTATLPVQTNCGHVFCGSCLITYWKHSPWLAAITCPLCRQKVVLLDNIFCEKQQDKPSKQIVHDIRDYNKRFSGQPRPFADYLYDMLLFLTLALRGIFTWGGLVWIFFLRVAVCSFGTIICLSSAFDMKPGPLCRTLGTADDMVVVSLLLICMINTCQQIASNGVNMARSAAQSMLSES
ncbi:E3 ubiquitin-protein ligase RNF170 [Haliaeetus albicilla]|uniref:E3 ubiquitin-protein ligase RNF170 n=1 Tax=Haliaeetus albicilla TaxID=8969 RepID=UPI0037E99CC7